MSTKDGDVDIVSMTCVHETGTLLIEGASCDS